MIKKIFNYLESISVRLRKYVIPFPWDLLWIFYYPVDLRLKSNAFFLGYSLFVQEYFNGSKKIVFR